MYNDPNYSEMQDSKLVSMCSNPTNLKYFRITTEDGKPEGNGGKIVGYIDDIQLWDNLSTIEDESENMISQESIIENLPTTYSEDFINCNNSDCDKSWILNNPKKLFIDVVNQNFHFDSQVTGINDKAHHELDSSLSDKWTLRFKLHIENLIEHPHGKGILQIDPDIRRLVLGIPAIVLPITGYFISRKTPSKILSTILIVNGLLIIAGISTSFYINSIENTNYPNQNIIELIFAMTFGAFIAFLGITKIKKNKIHN